MRTIGQKLIKGAIAQTISMVITLVAGMVLLPLIIHHLGDRLYGAWAIVSMAIGYYGLLDLGLSSAVSRFVSRALGSNNRSDADIYITNSLFLFFLAGTACLILTIIIVWGCGIFLNDRTEISLFRKMFFITGLSLAITFPGRCYIGILIAYLRYDLISIITIIDTCIRTALFIFVLLHGGKLLALVIITASLSIPRTAAFIALTHHIHGKTYIRKCLLSQKHIRTLLTYGFYTFLAQISDLLRLNSHPFIISGFLNLSAVAPYNIAEKLKTIVVKLSTALLSIMAPVFSRQESRGTDDIMKRSYFFTYKIACYTGTFFVITATILGRNFVIRWLGEDYINVVPLLHILLLGCFFAIIQIPTLNFLYGTSRNRFYAITNAFEGIGNIILSIVLIQKYGLAGMAYGMLIASAITKFIIQPWWVCRVFNLTLIKYHFSYTIPYLVRPLIFGLAAFFVSQYTITPVYWRLFVFAIISFLTYIIYIVLIGFNKTERNILFKAIFS